jgi:hypothetical protein
MFATKQIESDLPIQRVDFFNQLLCPFSGISDSISQITSADRLTPEAVFLPSRFRYPG